jgi:hypothetical protein
MVISLAYLELLPWHRKLKWSSLVGLVAEAGQLLDLEKFREYGVGEKEADRGGHKAAVARRRDGFERAMCQIETDPTPKRWRILELYGLDRKFQSV